LGAHLLTETPDGAGVRFPHALVREAIYAGTPPSRRRAGHRRVAEALAATATPDPDLVAYQFQQAGDARAAGWLIAAGERAARAYAWLSAAARFEAALQLRAGRGADARERGWLTLRLAELRYFADPRRALAHA